MNLRKLSKIAGVSPSTISLVLNNRPGVSEETRKHVLDVIAQNNYILPKKTDNKKQIAFIKYIKNGMIVEENSGFISNIMDSIHNECMNHNYSLNIIVSENCLEKTLIDLNYDNYQGIILVGTELECVSYPLLNRIPIPFVVLDNIMPNLNCTSVAINNSEIVYKALEYLASTGHKEIAYFRSDMSIQNFEERTETFLTAHKQHSLTYKPEHEFFLTPTLIGAYEAMKKYLEKGVSLPDCVFADNDTIAIGAIKALKEFGYKVPENISIIGFDDIHFSAINSLTTMSVPTKLMGSVAFKQLLNAMEEPSKYSMKIRIGGELVIRDSVKNKLD